MKRLIKPSTLRFLYESVPRWLILLIDICVILISVYGAFLLRFNFSIPQLEQSSLVYTLCIFLSIRLLFFIVFSTYKGIVRYTGSADMFRILKTLSLGTILITLINFTLFYFKKIYLIPNSVLIIEFLLSAFILIGSRLLVKVLYFEMRFSKKPKLDVIIYGASELAAITKQTLDRDRGAKYNIIGFIDHKNRMVKKLIEGIKVYEHAQLEELTKKNNVSHLIFASTSLSSSQKKETIDFCLDWKITVRDVPPVEKWINGQLSFNQIKHIKIDDLLGRDEIEIHNAQIENALQHKTILLTGAAGSIGSEIAHQILNYKPRKLILVDQAESPLHDLLIELRNWGLDHLLEAYIIDISNKTHLEYVFEKHRIDIVYHAAAYKHVPLMEFNAQQAVRVNIRGTKNLADLSDTYSADRFIMISTDKAVNPTNVMGASKRIAEIYIQALNKESSTNFITTRFGNVLGSNGSVIPLFKKQIEKGGPLTVTHPEITRYFMSIPEACKLVLEASIMGHGGEIFVFDMGESIKIIDLAKKMIHLSGLEPEKDIKIVFTGLRPGEKLYEELFLDLEKLKKTHHKDILISEGYIYPFKEINQSIEALLTLNKKSLKLNVKPLLKEILPEYQPKEEQRMPF